MHIVLFRGVGENEDKIHISSAIQELSARHRYGIHV